MCTPCLHRASRSPRLHANDKDGGCDHAGVVQVSGKPLKKMEEPSYFFRMGAYQERIIAHIKAHPEFVVPEARRNEVLERLAVPLQDLSVSRTTFDWGISCLLYTSPSPRDS